MLKNKRLKEAIENVGMVNNIDGQNFEKDFVGTAPVSYADAVLRARKHREDCKKAYEDQVKVAREALKKEVSNEEHPEPLAKIKGNKERKMTLDEGLFESFDDEHLGHEDDVCPKCKKNPCECNIKEDLSEESKTEESQDYKDKVATNLVRRYYQGSGMSLEQLHKELLRVFDGDIKRAFEFLLNFGKKKVEESLYPGYVSYQGKKMRVQGVRPDGKYALSEPKYSGLDITNHPEYLVYVSKEDVEPLSVIVYPNGREVTDIDLDKALSYQYGTDRDMDNSKYTDDEKQRAVNYWLEKTDGFDPYELSKEEVKPLEKSKKDAKVFRVTYKHSPTVFSSVMVKAASEDEAKQKLAVKEPGKDIIGVTVMSGAEVSDMTNRGMSLMEAKVIDDFSSYEPWGPAVSTFDSIQNADKMDALEQLIDEMYPDGIDKTELNDLLAFESDWIYSMLDMPHDEDVVYDDVAVEVEDDEEEE